MSRFQFSAARHARLALGVAAVALSACSSDDTVAPRPLAAGAFTVDARTGFVYVNLADSTTVTPTPTAGASGAWDIALFGTTVTLNGGEAGPGGVSGFCICQNSAANLTTEQWLALTPESELADFDAVTSVPAGADFETETLTPAITGWYAGSGATATARTDSTYFVRFSDSSGIAKVRIASITGASAANAGVVTLEYATALNAAAAFGTTQTIQLDLSTGAKNFDFQTGQVTASATDWDLRVDGWTMLVNGGMSGPGKGAATRITTATFADATPASTNARNFRIDRYTGVFGTSPFYKYDLQGDNVVTPTMDVYLLKRGADVYKLQITGYYSPTRQARFITFRYAQITG